MVTGTQTASSIKTAALGNLIESFSGIPDFPADIPMAPLLRLSLASLRKDAAESDALYHASKTLGFFYLDLRHDDQGKALLSDADGLFCVGEELFDLGREELDKFNYKPLGSYFGYKGFGKGIVDKSGTLDRNEFYNAGKDDFLGLSDEPWAHPDILSKTHPKLLKSYIQHSHKLVTLILKILNEHLCLPLGTLEKIHEINRVSGDQVRFIKSPPQPITNLGQSMGAHTDFGSVTILFNRVGGLQVLPPGEKDWVYVKPLPGHCIVNLGDAMVKFTNGLLRSNIHRVVAPPGKQVTQTRYSLVYFARPGDEVILKRLESDIIPPLDKGTEEEEINSRDWIHDKAMGRRAGIHKAP